MYYNFSYVDRWRNIAMVISIYTLFDTFLAEKITSLN
jgi:hypothetical protein